MTSADIVRREARKWAREVTARRMNGRARLVWPTQVARMLIRLAREIERSEKDDPARKFLERQEPLGAEFQKILYDNLHRLHEK